MAVQHACKRAVIGWDFIDNMIELSILYYRNDQIILSYHQVELLRSATLSLKYLKMMSIVDVDVNRTIKRISVN